MFTSFSGTLMKLNDRRNVGVLISGNRQPEFCGWAFNVERGQPCLDKWNLIPDNIDILVTHGPPIGETVVLHAACKSHL